MAVTSMPMPRLMYGTAWKKDVTADLVLTALKAGFRGLDTAAQPRHYQEDLVGTGIQSAISSGVVKRNDLFIQTKFTPLSGQDLDNLPYDPKASLEDQVHASLASSLRSFTAQGSESEEEVYIDSVVLHAPLQKISDTMRVWKALETYVPHRVRQLGISNCPLSILDHLCKDAEVKPTCVQLRFFPGTEWEVELRAYCRERKIRFQSFWTLKANPELLDSAPIRQLAQSAEIEKEVALYALVLGLQGTTILDGTTNEEHMMADLKVTDVVDVFSQSEEGRNVWSESLAQFKALIGEIQL